MEKILSLLLILGLFSCKEPSKDEVSETYPVVVKVLNIIPSEIPEPKNLSTASSDSLFNNYGALYYLVFDATGKYVHQIKQVKDDPSFGIISDQLKIGQYTIVLLSCTKELIVGAVLESLTATKVRSTATSGDIFYKKLTINVTPGKVNEKVLLDRMIGCIQVRIKDRVAENVAKVELIAENETNIFKVATGTVETLYTEPRTASAVVTSSNRDDFTLSLLLLNDQTPINATVRLLDASNNLIKSQRIPGIENTKGKIMSVEGYMSEFMGAGFSIGYNDTWPSDTTIINF